MPESAGSSIYVLRTATTDFRGKTITTTLDRMDRVATKALPAIPPGIAPATVEYTYTPVGRLDQVATVQYAAAVRVTDLIPVAFPAEVPV